MHVLFIDTAANASYDHQTFLQQGMGGSESTLARVALALSQHIAQHVHVTVLQSKREAHQTIEANTRLRFCSLSALASLGQVDVVVHQRDIQWVEHCAERWPHAMQVVWLHNWFENYHRKWFTFLHRFRVMLVCVSQYHQQQALRAAAATCPDYQPYIRYIYNPIQPELLKMDNSTRYDPFLLSYTSTPERGLEPTLDIFYALRQQDARFKLQVFNPGYFHQHIAVGEGVVQQGSRPMLDMYTQVRQSLCVLQANHTVPEMFGLIYAEANAVGVPVLAHTMGAAPEVLGDTHAQQLMDMTQIEFVVQRIVQWSNGERPQVKANAALVLDRIVMQWMQLFESCHHADKVTHVQTAAPKRELKVSIARAPTATLHPQQGYSKPKQALKVAIVTATYNRHMFLLQTLHYVLSQRCHVAALRWFVIDDSRQPLNVLAEHPLVDYHWLPEKIVLGHKRNLLNARALAWGADVICAMDDDDWYSADYVQDMIDLLDNPAHQFAGSSADMMYDVATGRILRIPAVSLHSTCNNILAYKVHVLPKAQYDAHAHTGEEPAFLGGNPVCQHANVQRIHMSLAHASNTVTKRNYVGDARLATTLTLDDFLMDAQTKAFYQQLT